MKTKNLIIPGVLAALVSAYLISIIPNFRRNSERKKVFTSTQSLSYDRVETAIQTFASDRKASGDHLPPSISLRELISGGYLRAEDVKGLEETDVTVSLTTDETTPQTILIRVRTGDGSEIVLLADGSIQGLPRR